MAHVAVMTFGFLNHPPGHEQVQGFVDRAPGVFAAADQAHGFISLIGSHVGREVSMPQFAGHCKPPRTPALTLSVWKDLESVFAFAYHGTHGEAFKKRRAWTQKANSPPMSCGG